MGFAITWFAIPEKNSAAFFARFGLSSTGERIEVPDCLIATAKLDTGWTLLWYDKYDCPFLDKRELAKVSVAHDIIRCLVEEHVMASSAEFWSYGSRKWFLSHEGENGPKGLVSDGELPDSFVSIKEKMEANQLANGGEKANVDYIFEIPLQVAKSVVGFKHDERCDHIPDNLFDVMERTSPRPGFFARLMGRR
jgi:hypothetical protein